MPQDLTGKTKSIFKTNTQKMLWGYCIEILLCNGLLAIMIARETCLVGRSSRGCTSLHPMFSCDIHPKRTFTLHSSLLAVSSVCAWFYKVFAFASVIAPVFLGMGLQGRYQLVKNLDSNICIFHISTVSPVKFLAPLCLLTCHSNIFVFIKMNEIHYGQSLILNLY